MSDTLSPAPGKRIASLGEGMWFAAALLLLIPVYLGHFDTGKLKYLLYAGSLAAYGLLCVKIFFLDGHSQKELLAFSPALAILVAGMVFSGTRAVLSTFLLATGAKNVPFRKISSAFFWFFGITFLLNLSLVLVGVLEDTVTIRGESIGYGNRRHSFGFGHPNSLGLWAMLIVFSALLCPKKGWVVTLDALAFSVAIFLLCDSKAAFFSSLAAIAACALGNRLCGSLSGKKYPALLSAGLMILIPFLFLAMSLLFQPGNRFWELANTALSQRLGYSRQGLDAFGFSLMGARVHFGWDPVDSLYAYMPICIGILPSLIFLGLHVYSVYRAARHSRWDIVAVALAGCLYSTMEYALMNPVQLPLFAACACLDDPAPRQDSAL